MLKEVGEKMPKAFIIILCKYFKAIQPRYLKLFPDYSKL